MLLADKLIKWEAGIGTEKGATWLQFINLFCWDLHQRNMTSLIEWGHRARREGKIGRRGGRMEAWKGGSRRNHKEG